MKRNRLPVIAAAAAAAVAVIAASARPVTEMLYPVVLRRAFKASDDKRDAGLTPPDDIVRITDRAYGTHPMQVLDVYYPKGTAEALPTIVSVHGGGYVYGDKDLYQYYCMNLAQRGFTVVNFSYRLAPDTRYPAQIEDVNAAVSWAAAHAEELFIDTDRMFFVGDSAGAQLLSQYAAAVTDPSYAEVLRMEIPAIHMRAIALNCGMYELSERDTAVRCYLTKKISEYGEELRILDHVTESYPPSFVMSAYGDFLLEMAAPMSELLTERHVENELHIYGEEDRPLGHVFHLNIRSEDARRCNDEECAFFRRYL